MRTVEGRPIHLDLGVPLLTQRLATTTGMLRTFVPEAQMGAAIQNNATAAEAAEKARKLNTVAHVAREFGEEGYNPRLLVRNEYTRILTPAAPYTDLALLIAAVGPKFAHIDTAQPPTEQELNKMVQAHSIYTLPREVQIDYWRDIRKTKNVLRNFVEEKANPDEYIIFAAENNILERTNPRRRTSRSIALPHTHILAINTNDIVELELDDLDPNMHHVLEEQKQLSKVNALLGERVYGHLTRADKDKMRGEFMERTAMPYGYSMHFDPAISDEDFADLMYGHNEAYTKALLESPELLEDATIPQPSQRIYILDDQVIFVTEFTSSGGVLEAAGVQLDRSPDYDQRIKAPELLEMNSRLKAAFGNGDAQAGTLGEEKRLLDDFLKGREGIKAREERLLKQFKEGISENNK
ncbi:MAG TPA: hypothetical protein VLF93_07545 [Candidatus Saccharimonadales bacterium]|nr:hypothetical protein [Candidatus Saccharimonadales bacterium]